MYYERKLYREKVICLSESQAMQPLVAMVTLLKSFARSCHMEVCIHTHFGSGNLAQQLVPNEEQTTLL